MLSVTLTKSVRTSNGKIGPVSSLCSEMKFSRSLNLTGGGAKILAASSMRSNCLLCCVLSHRAGAQILQAALEAVGLLGLPISSHWVGAGAGNVQQRVLFAAVDGEVIVAALAGIHKLQVDVFADALEIAVVPDLEGEGRGLAAALFHGPLVAAAGGVGIDRVGLAEGDVDVAAVGLPAGLAGGKVLVGVGDAPVMLFAELVLRRVGIGIAPQPELLDEGVALFVVAERS